MKTQTSEKNTSTSDAGQVRLGAMSPSLGHADAGRIRPSS